MVLFANYIEQFKRDLDLTNEDIAKIMEVGPATFDNYLCGYVSPSQQAMGKLIRILSLREPDGNQSLVLPPEKLPFGALALSDILRTTNPGEGFTLRVEDDALASHRVYSGALALIKKCGQPAPGDILLVSVDKKKARLMVYGEDSVIRLYDDSHELVLSRSEFETRVEIIGRLTCVENTF